MGRNFEKRYFAIDSRWVLLVLMLASPVIAQPDPDDEISTSAESSALNAFFHEPFQNPLGYSFFSWNAKQRILDRFGDPVSESSARYSARTSDEQLWSTTFSYPGVTFEIGENEDRTRTWLTAIDIRGGEHNLAFGLRVGSTRTDVEQAFKDSHFIEYDGGIRFGTEIWESRGEDTLTTAMELRVDVGSDGRVTRFLIESIEL